MPIRFFCPECNKPLSVGTRKAGTTIVCPACAGEATVPAVSKFQKRPAAQAGPAHQAVAVKPPVAVAVTADKCSSPVREPDGAAARAVAAPVTQRMQRGTAPIAPAAGRWALVVMVPVIALALGLAVVVALAGVIVVAARDVAPQAEYVAAEPAPPDGSQAAPTAPSGDTDLGGEAGLDVPPVARPELDVPVPDSTIEPNIPLPPSLPSAPALKQPGIAQPLLGDAGNRFNDLLGAAPPVVPPPVVAAPPAEKPRPANIVTARWLAKRRSHLTDEQLRKQLVLAAEAAVEAVPGASQALVKGSRRTAGAGVDLTPVLFAQRPDLFGLRPRTGTDSRMSKEESLTLQVLSQILRKHVETSMPGIDKGIIDLRPNAELLRKRLFDPQVKGQWLKPEAIPTLRQLLMHEDRNVRLILVEALAQIRNPRASAELAQRALFDLHPDVRCAALVALQDRPVDEYEDILIAGLGHPWPPVGDHAAEALIALDLRGVVPRLLPLLDAKEPGEPAAVDWGGKRIAAVTELVQINHLRNCLLCHPSSHSPSDPLRRVIPNVSERVPLPFSGGNGYGKPSAHLSTFVRADITYLRQDFSVLQPVPNHGSQWPAEQRFDYLLRHRPLDNQQLALAQERLKEFQPPSPRREALLFALRELTGEDRGPTADDWRRVYSTVTGERLPKALAAKDRVSHLREALTTAKPLRQADLLVAFRDRAGRDYDDAVALAIPLLKADMQKLGRAVLADRLHCLVPKDLEDRLGDQNEEFRIAAATVCGRRGERGLIPNLIDMLVDEQGDVGQQARLALKELTRQDFGPRRSADQDARRRAMASWHDWWDEQERKAAKKGTP
jgi:HEAT repeat protein